MSVVLPGESEKMKLEEYDYTLPKELIAQHPLRRREDSRLLVLDRAKDELRETRFFNFPRYLREGDLLVVNETKVIPARLFGRKSTGAVIEVFLTRKLEKKKWLAMVRPSKRVREHTFIYVGEEQYPLEITERLSEGRWIVTLPESIDEDKFLESGERCLNLCRAIYMREGRRGRKDDILEDFNFSKPIEDQPSPVGLFNPELMMPGRDGECFQRSSSLLVSSFFLRV